MHLNHPETILPSPWSMKKLSSMKLVLVPKRLGTTAINLSLKESFLGSLCLSPPPLSSPGSFILFLYCVLYCVKEIIIKALSSWKNFKTGACARFLDLHLWSLGNLFKNSIEIKIQLTERKATQNYNLLGGTNTGERFWSWNLLQKALQYFSLFKD